MKYTYSELVLKLDLRKKKKGVSFWDTCQPCLNGKYREIHSNGYNISLIKPTDWVRFCSSVLLTDKAIKWKKAALEKTFMRTY